MAVLTVGLLVGVVAVVSCSIPKGEKIDFYEQSSIEVR